MNILAFAGSLRQKSYNRGLIRAAQELKPEGMEIEVFEISPIPLYSQDVEDQGLPESVTQLKTKIEAANAILIATPEYNHSVSGVLKNAIDWASRPPKNSFDGKPVGIIGASPGGFGTVRAQVHLRSVISALNSYPMAKPELLVGSAGENFDADGNLTDQKTKERLTKFLAAFKKWVTKLS